MTRNEVLQIVNDSIDRLFRDDISLLINNVSERSITHKLAEHMQSHFPNLNVDCEYNRNIEIKPNSPKYLNMIVHSRREQLGECLARDVSEEALKAYSTFPDIIVHRREHNDQNILVIEVKKTTSDVADDYDFEKLCGFTGNQNENNYRYEHGVFIKFETEVRNPSRPIPKWFTNGQQD